MCERELETEQNCNISTPTLLAITAFLSRSPRLLNPGALGPGASLSRTSSSIQHLLSNSAHIGSLRAHSAVCWLSLPASFLQLVWSPTDWISYAQRYIIVQGPPSSCGRHKSHSFNPSTVKVIFWYSSTGCTCYLHRCISYFDSPAGSEVNMQHMCYILTIVFFFLQESPWSSE